MKRLNGLLIDGRVGSRALTVQHRRPLRHASHQRLQLVMHWPLVHPAGKGTGFHGQLGRGEVEALILLGGRAVMGVRMCREVRPVGRRRGSISGVAVVVGHGIDDRVAAPRRGSAYVVAGGRCSGQRCGAAIAATALETAGANSSFTRLWLAWA